MTDRKMIEKLLEYGSKMRDAQKAHHQHPGGGASQKIKNQLAVKARQATAEFDNVLFNVGQFIK